MSEAEKKPPLPVEVANVEPLEATVAAVETARPVTVTTAAGQEVLAPTTTEQEDKVTAGQRLVNVMWELTQSIIAVAVVATTMAKAFILLPGQETPTILAVAFGTVVGFYFARTNHQAIGGVGRKSNEDQPYRGR